MVGKKYPKDLFLKIKWDTWYFSDLDNLTQKIKSEENRFHWYKTFRLWLNKYDIKTQGTGQLRGLMHLFSIILPHLIASEKQRMTALKKAMAIDIQDEIASLKTGRDKFVESTKINPISGRRQRELGEKGIPRKMPYVAHALELLDTYIASFEGLEEPNPFYQYKNISRQRGVALQRIYIRYLDRILKETVHAKRARARAFLKLFASLNIEGFGKFDLLSLQDPIALQNPKSVINSKINRIEKHLLKFSPYNEIDKYWPDDLEI